MKNPIIAVVVSAGQKFCIAEHGGNKYFLHNQQGPVGFVTDDAGKSMFDRSNWPDRQVVPGSHVILVPGMYDKVYDTHRVEVWGLVADAKATENAHKRLPVYVIQQRQRIVTSGKLGSWANPIEVFRGTLPQMMAQSQRDGRRTSNQDKFAPRYMTTGVVAETVFYVVEGVTLNACLDPRPFPKSGSIYRAVRTILGVKPKVIAQGTVGEIAYEYPRLASGNDHLRSGCGADIVWQKLDGETWSECEDPREIEKAEKAPGLEDLKSLDLAGHFGGTPSTAGVAEKKNERVPAGK